MHRQQGSPAGRTEIEATASVSIAILNRNGQLTLPDALRAILKQRTPIAETILMDDASTDDSVRLARQIMPGITILCFEDSRRHVNLLRSAGLRRARTQLVFMMDNDIILREDTLSTLISHIQELPGAALCTPRLLYADDPERVYTDGQRLHYLCTSIHYNRDARAAPPGEIMSGTYGGGVVLVDKSKAEEAGLFDEDYLFGWRDDGILYRKLALLGHVCYHVPEAAAYHFGKVRYTERARAQTRNRWMMIL